MAAITSPSQLQALRRWKSSNVSAATTPARVLFAPVFDRRSTEQNDCTRVTTMTKADLWEPPLPEPDADGRYPALEAVAVIQARDILRLCGRPGTPECRIHRLLEGHFDTPSILTWVPAGLSQNLWHRRIRP